MKLRDIEAARLRALDDVLSALRDELKLARLVIAVDPERRRAIEDRAEIWIAAIQVVEALK